jgi:sulfur-oxidizing protein SoxX
MNQKSNLILAAVLGTAFGCTALQAADDIDKTVHAVIKESFRTQGQAKAEWLEQDAVQAACSAAQPPSAEKAKELEAEQMKTVMWPADGKYLGDWKSGESIAQSGRGMTWSDKADAANGGGCYNCHQLSKEEISFGTIGPTLYNYGDDPAAPASEAVVKYTWAKIYNAKAYNACSTMPRLGHAKVLTEQQIRDVMALLLDPQSPVNK